MPLFIYSPFPVPFILPSVPCLELISFPRHPTLLDSIQAPGASHPYLCFFVLLCAYLCLFGSQKHNISLLPWLVLTPSLAWGAPSASRPPPGFCTSSWSLSCLFVLICASLCYFVQEPVPGLRAPRASRPTLVACIQAPGASHAYLCFFVLLCAYLALKNIICLFSPGSCSPRPWLAGS